MEILKGLLIAVELIVSLLLILIILVQPSKSGGGLGGAAFGGGMGEQLFGARAGNVLTRGTVIFSVIFLVNTLALAVVYTRTAGLRIGHGSGQGVRTRRPGRRAAGRWPRRSPRQPGRPGAR